MKKLLAIVIAAAALVHAAFAAQQSTPAPAAKAGPVAAKSCYKKVSVQWDNSSYNDNFDVGGRSGGFGYLRVPCATTAKK